MPSKRSFFNRTLFRKHLSRFWPLWGGVSLVGAMVPLYLLLALVQRRSGGISAWLFSEGVYQVAAYFVPGFTAAYAILCAMAVWGYLHSARSVGLLHALPADRTCLFITNALAGLAMALLPYAVTGGLLCLTALIWGFFDLVAVVNAVLMVLFMSLLFFGMATLCAMLTGHAFVLPAFYLLANFLAFIMEFLITSLAQMFLLGIGSMKDTGRLSILSPVIKLYGSVGVHLEYLPDGTPTTRLVGLWVAALYALAGLAMLALAWFLYGRRHSESAGDVVAFRWLRPVFRYGVALLGGLTVGRLLYELMWGSLFQRGQCADALPMAVCICLGGLVGYYAASMLLEKSLRVFRGSWRGAAAVAAGAAALCLLVSVDLFGVERRVPEPDEIENVMLLDRGLSSGPYSAQDNPVQAEALRALHQAIVDDRSYIRSYVPNWDYMEARAFSHSVTLIYRLKDGSTLQRNYDLWLTGERVETAGTYDSLLAQFYQDPTVRMDGLRIPEGAELDSIDIYYYNKMSEVSANTGDHAGGDDRETRQIYAALLADAQEGNVPACDVLRISSEPSALYLYLRYWEYTEQGSRGYYRSKTVYLAPSMTHTLAALTELGYLTEEDVAHWAEDVS